MNVPLLQSSTSAMIILINENVQNQFLTKARGFIPKYDQKSIKSKFLKSLKNVLELVQVVSILAPEMLGKRILKFVLFASVTAS